VTLRHSISSSLYSQHTPSMSLGYNHTIFKIDYQIQVLFYLMNKICSFPLFNNVSVNDTWEKFGCA
jgi:hypothetical protein